MTENTQAAGAKESEPARLKRLNAQQEAVDKQVLAFLIGALESSNDSIAALIIEKLKSEPNTTLERVIKRLLSGNDQASAAFHECWDQVYQKWWYIGEYWPDVSSEELAPFNEVAWKWAKLTAESLKNP